MPIKFKIEVTSSKDGNTEKIEAIDFDTPQHALDYIEGIVLIDEMIDIHITRQ